MFSTFNLTSKDNYKLSGYKWSTENKIKGSVVIIHGMAEHALRYEDFAFFLNSMGYQVYSMDLRGHGEDARLATPGWFGNENGWFLCIDDIKALIDYVKKQEEADKICLLGHSMGSLLVRSYLIKYLDSRIDKAVLSGTTAGLPRYKLHLARLLSNIACKTAEPKKPSQLMDKLIFGSYAKSVPGYKTKFDWLTCDAEKVDKYIRDPLCGFVCSAQFYNDLINGTLYCNKDTNLKKINASTRLLIISGSEDPVGRFGKDIDILCKKINPVVKQGSVDTIVYGNMRHEIINEIDHVSVYKDILQFIDANY